MSVTSGLRALQRGRVCTGALYKTKSSAMPPKTFGGSPYLGSTNLLDNRLDLSNTNNGSLLRNEVYHRIRQYRDLTR